MMKENGVDVSSHTSRRSTGDMGSKTALDQAQDAARNRKRSPSNEHLYIDIRYIIFAGMSVTCVLLTAICCPMTSYGYTHENAKILLIAALAIIMFISSVANIYFKERKK